MKIHRRLKLNPEIGIGGIQEENFITKKKNIKKLRKKLLLHNYKIDTMISDVKIIWNTFSFNTPFLLVDKKKFFPQLN